MADRRDCTELGLALPGQKVEGRGFLGREMVHPAACGAWGLGRRGRRETQRCMCEGKGEPHGKGAAGAQKQRLKGVLEGPKGDSGEGIS